MLAVFVKNNFKNIKNGFKVYLRKDSKSGLKKSHLYKCLAGRIIEIGKEIILVLTERKSSHLSDSTEQKAAEEVMLSLLEEQLSCKFDFDDEFVIDESLIKPDAIDRENKIIVEVYARIGVVRGAQKHKIKGDILKLAFIEKRLGINWRKIMCFASNEAAKYVQGKSWAAEAAKEFGIEIFVVELPESHKEKIISAQKRQRMINPS